MAWTTAAPKPFDVEEHTRIIVRQLKARDGLSNRALAGLLGMSEQSLSDRIRAHWTGRPDRNGKSTQPPFRHSELKRLTEIFGVPESYFFQPVELVLVPPHSPPSRTNMGYSGSSVVRSAHPAKLARTA